jgi:hypothetical protein
MIASITSRDVRDSLWVNWTTARASFTLFVLIDSMSIHLVIQTQMNGQLAKLFRWQKIGSFARFGVTMASAAANVPMRGATTVFARHCALRLCI